MQGAQRDVKDFVISLQKMFLFTLYTSHPQRQLLQIPLRGCTEQFRKILNV